MSRPLKAHLVVVSVMKSHYSTLFCKSAWKNGRRAASTTVFVVNFTKILKKDDKQEIEHNSYGWILFLNCSLTRLF